MYAQIPVADYTIQTPSCLNEQQEIINNSTNSNTYSWDFCLGDFKTTPSISVNYGTATSAIYGLKIVKYDGKYYGFALGSSTLYRIEYNADLGNTNPVITDLGNFDGLITNAEGIDIVKEGNQWIGIAGFGSSSNTGNLLRLTWSDLTLAPSVESLGNFNVGGRMRDIQIVRQLGNYILVAPNYNNNTLIRIDFGNSMTNTPTLLDVYESNVLTDVSLPPTMSVVKKAGNWQVVVGSILTKIVSVFDLGPDILSEPVFVKSENFTSSFTNYLVKMDAVRDGDNFYALVSELNNPMHLLDLKSLSNSDTFEEVTLSGMPTSYGLDIFKDKSKYYGLGARTHLQLLTFESFCNQSQTISSDTNPFITYYQDGTYAVELIASNLDEDYDYSVQNVIISTSLAPEVTSQITGNCLSSPISFEGQQISGSINSWSWDFGDGLGTSTLQKDSYTFGTAGTYQVKLNVTDINGCSNLLIDTVQVYDEPIPDFTYPAGTFCMNNPISFTNTSTGETGPVVNWTWDFNGEGTSSAKDTVFTFTTSGSKTIELKSSIPGCANVVQKVIFVEEAPTVDFSFDNVCNGQTTTFNDLTTGNNLVTWDWDFGDGNTSASQNPTHSYANPGQYNVMLTVTNSIGCSTTLTQSVLNHNIPTVNFTNELACSSSPIHFTDRSLVQNANLVAWQWDFGDTNTSTDQNPSHLYGQTGDFTVQLKAYSEFGCVDSVSNPITVLQGPEVDFSWDKSCSESTTTFTDLTTNYGFAVIDRTWIIDSNVKTDQNPSYTFSTPGTYTIQQSVTLDNLCAQTVSKDMIVKEPPLVQFGYNESCGASGTLLYDLTDQSNDKITGREWRIDGQMVSADSVFESQLVPGTYSIALTVLTSSGCNESSIQNISLIGSPNASFTLNTDYGASPLSVSFSNTSTGGDVYEWQFGDVNNSTSTEKNPTFTFNDIGTYTVVLKTSTSTNSNCFSETTHTINVVVPDEQANIQTVIPFEDNGHTSYLITIENTGTTTLNNNNQLIIRANYGTEVIEQLNSVIYAGKTINYIPSFATTNGTLPNNVCVELVGVEGNILDRNCASTNNQNTITLPYPNPAKNLFTIDVILPEAQEILVRILNSNGQEQLINSYPGINGLNQLTLDVTSLLQGLYIIELTAGSTTQQYKISIVR